MPTIYLKHEKHGYKVCHSEAEAAYDRGHGWKDHVPAVPAPVVVEPPAGGPVKQEGPPAAPAALPAFLTPPVPQAAPAAPDPLVAFLTPPVPQAAPVPTPVPNPPRPRPKK